MIETIAEIFLLPWTLLGWIFKWFISGAIWFKLFGSIYAMLRNEWTFRNPFVKKETVSLEDDEFYGV